MTAPAPVRDSVLDALGFAIRVVAKPGYWWAPTLLMTITVLPILALPASPAMPFGQPPFSQQSPFATQAEMNAYFAAFVPVIVASAVLAIVLGPLVSALAYRLAKQFSDGEAAQPFAPGLIQLAWRFFLQALAFLLLLCGAWLLLVVILVIEFALHLVALGFLITFLVGVVGVFVVYFRVAVAPALLLSGAGPIEAIRQSWRMSRGHLWTIFRWVIVSGLIIAITGSILSTVIGLLFIAVGLPTVGSFLGTVAYGAFSVVEAIVLLRLVQVLSGPVAPPLPPELPAWMNTPGPADPRTARGAAFGSE